MLSEWEVTDIESHGLLRCFDVLMWLARNSLITSSQGVYTLPCIALQEDCVGGF